MKRPPVITVLAVLQIAGAVVWLLILGIGAVGLLLAKSPPENANLAYAFLGFFLAAALLQFACGLGLWRLKPYGRWLQIALAAIGLIGIPVGTLIGALILYYMFKPGVQLVFSGRPPDLLAPSEVASIAAVSQRSTALIGVGVVAGVLIILIPFLGIVAAIAVPGLLRARMSGNEAVAIGTLRGFAVAEASYAAGNGGYFDRSACLVRPGDCKRGFNGQSFLREAPNVKSGYRFFFFAGAQPEPLPDSVSRTSMTGYTLFAAPVTPNSTGTRMFCLDGAAATIRMSAVGAVDLATLKRTCPSDWADVK